MSKTKEEILQHHYIHDRGLVNPVLYVHNAMDAWADHKLEEYRKKLHLRIKEMSDKEPDRDTDFAQGYIEACEDIILITSEA